MMSDTADLFRGRLDQMSDLRHPLAVLASRMPWQEIEASIAHGFAKQVRAGKTLSDMDLFGSTVSVIGAGVSKAGRPRLPMRLMISLLYLKHAFNESDEGVVVRWAETPTWQYFSGQEYFEHRWPCDPSLLVRYRQLLGEAGVEELMARTINVAVHLKLIDVAHLRTLIFDNTVQEKAFTHPADSKILETANNTSAGPRTTKLYNWHAPELQCITKGKSRNPLEFSAKVGIAMTQRLHRSGLPRRRSRNPQIEIRNRVHGVLCITGYNIRWLLRMIAKHSLRAFLRLLHITHHMSTTYYFAQASVNSI